ncbi:hypothetical protein T492DRAFT_50367 [Pavlovales sp. CCMP2436]|nr:hypothetical protein T492DRAFT_50367 [Pavlovales sp. CCMP2436]
MQLLPQVLGPTHTRGWWRGRLNGRQGLFPENYVTFEGGWASTRERTERLSSYGGSNGSANGTVSGKSSLEAVPLERGPLAQFLELTPETVTSRALQGVRVRQLRARDRSTGELVAVKVVCVEARESLSAGEVKEMALSEAKLLQMLSQPHPHSHPFHPGSGASCVVSSLFTIVLLTSPDLQLEGV